VNEWKCIVCGEVVTDYEPEYCCYGNIYGTEYHCGCMGLPIEPPLCSLECTEKVYGKSVEEGKT
jgi:hypothetical protein